MKLAPIVLFLFFATQVLGQTTVTKTITIGPSLTFQNYEHFKRLTLDAPDSAIEYVEGFNFEWGYTYTLNVTETKLETPLSDGTQYEYTLNRIVAKTKVPKGTKFKLILDPARYYDEDTTSDLESNNTFKRINDSTYSYFDQVEIEVPPHLKKKFQQTIERGKARVGYFVFNDKNRIRLINL